MTDLLRNNRTYFKDDWQSILAFNGLNNFDDIWNLQLDWFEPPNFRRGGWSGVGQYSFKYPGGGTMEVFIKKQKNHTCRRAHYGFAKRPTLEREFINIMRYQSKGIPTLEPLYYGQACEDNDAKAILITRSLEGYIDLQTVLSCWHQAPFKHKKIFIIKKVADAVRHMHYHRFRHSCLYPNHILLSFPGADINAVAGLDDIKIRMIDLEKMRVVWRRRDAALRDMVCFAPRVLNVCSDVRRTDMLRFFKLYLGCTRLDKKAKQLWYEIRATLIKKHRIKV